SQLRTRSSSSASSGRSAQRRVRSVGDDAAPVDSPPWRRARRQQRRTRAVGGSDPVPGRDRMNEDRPPVFAFAGGDDAFLALATAFHARCLADPVLSHPFSHPRNPEHVQRLADYWGEVFGGPPRYSESFGGHSAMLEIHARAGAENDLGRRF